MPRMVAEGIRSICQFPTPGVARLHGKKGINQSSPPGTTKSTTARTQTRRRSKTFILGNPKAFVSVDSILAKVNNELSSPPSPSDTQELSRDEVIEPGAEMLVALPAGPAAIRLLEVRPDSADAQALRSLVLRASFDGRETIWCPRQRFFRKWCWTQRSE